MSTKQSLISIVVRLVVAFLLLLLIFYFFDPFNALKGEADTLNFIVLGIYAPLFITTLTIAICSILAIPLWYSHKVRNWWYSKPILQIIIISLGFILLFLSLLDYFKVNGFEQEYGKITSVSLVNEFLSLPGWFLIAISFLTIDLSTLSNRLFRKIIKEADWTESPNR